MSIPVFGLQAIKDKATRDAIYQLAQRAGTGDGSGGVAVDVQTDDPNPNDDGTQGDIIYATGSESIWIFTGTEWERASSAESGVTVLIEAYSEGVMPVWSMLSGVNLASPNFKNDSAKVIGLAPRIYEGGVEIGSATYSASSTTYTWLKNGLDFTPQQTQESDTGKDKRVLLINQDDVGNNNVNEVFTCIIDY